jgi:hypothetical protein
LIDEVLERDIEKYSCVVKTLPKEKDCLGSLRKGKGLGFGGDASLIKSKKRSRSCENKINEIKSKNPRYL